MFITAEIQLRNNPLNGENFLLWEKLLKKMLDINGIGYTIEVPLSAYPINLGTEAIIAYEKRRDDYNFALVIMTKSIII